MRTLFLFATLAIIVTGCSNSSDLGSSGAKSQEAKKDAVKRTWTRDEFKALVMGKTKDEVLKLVGKPDKTGQIVNDTTFDYDKVTSDPITGKVDLCTVVWFTPEGIVYKVQTI